MFFVWIQDEAYLQEEKMAMKIESNNYSIPINHQEFQPNTTKGKYN